MKYLIVIWLTMCFLELNAQHDTLRPNSFLDSCALRVGPGGQNIPDLALFSNPLGGFVCGRSIYHMKTKAQKFYHQNGKLTQVAFLFGARSQAPFPGLIRAKAYRVDPSSGAPADMIAESDLFSVGNIKTFVNVDSNNQHTILSFRDTVLLPDSFFVGLDLTWLAVGDTVGLWSTRDGCYSGAQLAWEEDSAGAWHPFNDGTPSTSWGLDIDMAIFPMGDFGLETGIEKPNSESTYEINVYPNPAGEQVFLNGELGSERIIITLYDARGTIAAQHHVQRNSGASYVIKVSQLQPGVYFYRISSNNEKDHVTGKILVKR